MATYACKVKQRHFVIYCMVATDNKCTYIIPMHNSLCVTYALHMCNIELIASCTVRMYAGTY